MRRHKNLLLAVSIIGTLCIIFGALYYLSVIRRKNAQQATANSTCTTSCNILLISVDSLRADHIGAFGYSRNTTPNFDKLAKQGTLFTNYFSSSFLTPVSEMTVQTGLYPTSTGVNNFDSTLPQDILTLPQYTKKLGYYTQAIMSSPEFISYPTLQNSFSRGFDSYHYAQPADSSSHSVISRRFPTIKEVASAFTSEKNKKQPTFLWLALGGVHWPYGLGDPNIYADMTYNGPLANQPLQWNLFQNVYQNTLYPNKIKLTSNDIQYVRDEYDNGVYAFDNFLGQVVNQLQSQNLLKKTIIVLESEHGEDLGEHGYFAHYDVLDTQTHTPLLIVNPSTAGNKRISSLTGSVDILPTILNLIGTSSSNGLQGKSLVPLLNDSETDGQRNAIFLERIPLWEEADLGIRQAWAQRGVVVTSAGDHDIAIRTNKWKYILRLSQQKLEQISWWNYVTGQSIIIPNAELYNLIDDPGETKNVIAQYPDVAAQLNQQLNSWYAKILSVAPKNIQNTNVIQPYF